jgi:hypothetical protein
VKGFPIAWIQWLSDLAGIVNGLQKEGPTARRPVAVPYLGFFYYDTTLGKPIWAKTQAPATWVDATGAPV